MIRRIVKWLKIRFVFSNEQLEAALVFFGRVDRVRLNDERLWNEVQYNVKLLESELARRKLNACF